MFNASEKVNSIKDNLSRRHVHILIFIPWKNKRFHNWWSSKLVGILFWHNLYSNCLFKITFFSSQEDGRGQIMKKGQAGSSIKILNKAKIILIITNGNVDFITLALPCYDAVPCLSNRPWILYGKQQSRDFESVQVKYRKNLLSVWFELSLKWNNMRLRFGTQLLRQLCLNQTSINWPAVSSLVSIQRFWRSL